MQNTSWTVSGSLHERTTQTPTTQDRQSHLHDTNTDVLLSQPSLDGFSPLLGQPLYGLFVFYRARVVNYPSHCILYWQATPVAAANMTYVYVNVNTRPKARRHPSEQIGEKTRLNCQTGSLKTLRARKLPSSTRRVVLSTVIRRPLTLSKPSL